MRPPVERASSPAQRRPLHGLRIEYLAVEKDFHRCQVDPKAFGGRLLLCEVRSLAVRSASLDREVSLLDGGVALLKELCMSIPIPAHAVARQAGVAE